jgi:hypothetical protein
MRNLAVLFSLMFVGCSSGIDETPVGPYTVEVVSLLAPSAPGSAATFEIAPKTLSTLQDLNSLQGTFVRFFSGGTLKAKSVLGSIVANGYFEGGDSPKLRYHVANGVVTPSDYFTLSLLSAYYQFDLIAQNVKDIFGIEATALSRAQRNSVYQVLFEPTLDVETSGVSGSVSSKRNAAFVPGQGQFVLFERSRSERVPLSANLQVISHEFGHAIFDYTFFDNSFSAESAYSGNFVIAGLNEGVADFTSFLWSKSGDVLSGSLTGIGAVAERNFVLSSFVLSDVSSLCSGGFYCLGTLFARSLWQVTVDLPQEVSALTLSIPARLRAARLQLDASGLDVDPQSAEYGGVTSSDYRVLKIFLKSFLETNSSITPNLSSRLCARLTENFSLAAEADWSCQ